MSLYRIQPINIKSSFVPWNHAGHRAKYCLVINYALVWFAIPNSTTPTFPMTGPSPPLWENFLQFSYFSCFIREREGLDSRLKRVMLIKNIGSFVPAWTLTLNWSQLTHFPVHMPPLLIGCRTAQQRTCPSHSCLQYRCQHPKERGYDGTQACTIAHKL